MKISARDGTTSPRSIGIAAAIILGLLLVALPLEYAGVWIGKRCADDVADIAVPLKLSWIETGRAKADIVLLGDSFTKMGLDPSRFQEVTGRTTINLGTIVRVSLYGQRFMLERYLSHHTPSIVVLNVLDETFSREARHYPEDHYYLSRDFLRFQEILYLFRRTHKADILLAQLLHKLLPLPSIYYRNHVQAAFGNILSLTVGGGSLRSSCVAQGSSTGPRAVLEANSGWFPLEGFHPSRSLAAPETPAIHESLLRELERIFVLCREKNIPVAFGLNAISESAANGPWGAERVDMMDALEGTLRERHPEVRFLHPLQAILPDEDFYDRHHLHAEAARRYSARVAAQIAPLLRPGASATR